MEMIWECFEVFETTTDRAHRVSELQSFVEERNFILKYVLIRDSIDFVLNYKFYKLNS
jgi:hypothetical protein